MNQTLYFANLREQVVFSPDGPRPQVLVQTDKLKALVAGLEPGQTIPPHPEELSMYYFLEGTAG